MIKDEERREVVRCRDCRHAYWRGGDVYCSRVLQWGSNDRPAPLPVDPDGFCAWGEGSGRVMGPTYSVDVDALTIDTGWYDTREQAIAAWNRRAERNRKRGRV